jgi:hypothetical protein
MQSSGRAQILGVQKKQRPRTSKSVIGDRDCKHTFASSWFEEKRRISHPSLSRPPLAFFVIPLLLASRLPNLFSRRRSTNPHLYTTLYIHIYVLVFQYIAKESVPTFPLSPIVQARENGKTRNKGKGRKEGGGQVHFRRV